MRALIVTICLISFSLTSQNSGACTHGFFPNNSLIADTSIGKITKKHADAASITQTIKQIYAPVFLNENKKLHIDIVWDDLTINAYATRDQDNNPIVNITEGMLNQEFLSLDGLALIICHEIGHFLGGAPKKLRGNSNKKSWSSAEGQADYFATSHCIKKAFKKLPALNPIIEEELREELDSICESAMCRRIAKASFNVANVYAIIDLFRKDLSLVEKDEFKVHETFYGHPNPQCRLDTMIAGLKCTQSEKIIFSNENDQKGTCKDHNFARPRCWYAPTTSF